MCLRTLGLALAAAMATLLLAVKPRAEVGAARDAPCCTLKLPVASGEPAPLARPSAAPQTPGSKPFVLAGEPALASGARVPAPRPLAVEAEHRARLDAALAPLSEHPLDAAEAAGLREAIAAAVAGRVADAKARRSALSDPTARKLVDWSLLRAGYGGAREIAAFLEANPAWPDRVLLTRRAEEALFTSAASPAEVKSFFAGRQPATAAGYAALASAHLAENNEAAARALAAKAWRELDLPASLEEAFLRRVGGKLTTADHKHRLDRLLLADSRWAGERAERAAVIRRVISHLADEEKAKAEARLAVFLRRKDAAQLIARLPVTQQKDWGLTVQKAQSLRRQNHEEQAWKLLLAEPPDPEAAMPDGWWEERRLAAYAALRAGKPKLAYDLVRDPGRLSVNSAKDAAFMAGWLALRHLRDPRLALGHFAALLKAADGPLSLARAHYWVGRTHEALGHPEAARESFRAGAAYVDTFHGQLAILKLDPGATALPIAPPARPGAEAIARFNALDAAKAAVIVRKAGLDISVLRAFLFQLSHAAASEAEVAMVAHLAEVLGDTQTAVRIGKAAVAHGQNLLYYAYPIHALPAFAPLGRPPEAAFLLGIARQESEFDTTTLSGAGARGLLQVMPVTARHVCSEHKVKCEVTRLMKDPTYNTMMGSAYLSDRMQEFGGSYVLTLAGYNAGPGRARQWMREFGDPRDPKVDPIDWIHRIPFTETREYVQKVFSNIQVYRARLGEKSPLRLNADLHASPGARPLPQQSAKLP